MQRKRCSRKGEAEMAKDLILYRTKAACEIRPDAEKGVVWTSFAEGNGGKPVKGQRKYEWENKIILALSPEEVTDLSLAAKMLREGGKQSISFYHDPAKSERCEGEAKVLSLSPGNGSKALAFLSVKQGERQIAIAMGTGDLWRLETLLPIAVCRLLEWI
jgi:hypothetical protein